MSQSSNVKQPKIFVAVSSWARGEWAPGTPVTQHNGIKQYFADAGYTPEFANQVCQKIDSISDSTRIMDELIFHPDGLHPNREGHTILYKHLTELLHL